MALVLYTDAAAGSDNNGGSSAGAAKATGTAAVTNGTATVALDAATDLSTVVVGDTIRIAARTDGLRSTNIYEITAVNDGADTVDVTPSPAAAAGQTWSIGGAWATLGKAEDVVRPGDKVWVKGGTSYTETVTFAAGSVGDVTTGAIVWEGYASATGDGGMFTIDGGASRTNGVVATAPTNMFTVFKNMRITNHTGTGFLGDSGTAHAKFKKCRFDTNGSIGVTLGAGCTFEGCYAHGNTGDGFSVLGTLGCFLGCISNSNGGKGFTSDGMFAWKCIAFSNAGIAFESATAANHVMIECVADGDGKDTDTGFALGTAFTGSFHIVAINCVAYDCTTGFAGNAIFGERACSRNNAVNSNTSAYSGFATHTGEVTAAPSFVNEGSQDYGITSGSPLKNTGFGAQTNGWLTTTGDNPDIGAIDEVASGAGLTGARTLRSGGRML